MILLVLTPQSQIKNIYVSARGDFCPQELLSDLALGSGEAEKPHFTAGHVVSISPTPGLYLNYWTIHLATARVLAMKRLSHKDVYAKGTSCHRHGSWVTVGSGSGAALPGVDSILAWPHNGQDTSSLCSSVSSSKMWPVTVPTDRKAVRINMGTYKGCLEKIKL